MKVLAIGKTISEIPPLLEQWHPTKNGNLTPENITQGAHTLIWWKCEKGPDHVWETSPNSRTSKQLTGCPFCRNIRLSITNRLDKTYPHLAKQWHSTNNRKKPTEVIGGGSNKKYWWKCDKGSDHVWSASLVSRAKGGRGCPYCSGKRVSKTNRLSTLFPKVAREWHPTRNGSVTPSEVMAGSSTKKYWWKCDVAKDHVWETTIQSRTGIGSGCPYCAGRMVSATNRLDIHFPEVAKEWASR